MRENKILRNFLSFILSLGLVFLLGLSNFALAIDQKDLDDMDKLDYNIEKTYYSIGANVRDLDNHKLGYLHKGRYINGREDKSYVYFTYHGQDAKVSKNFLNYNLNTYASKGVNVRSLNGDKLGYLKSGNTIEGYRQGNYVHFIYNNKSAQVHRSFLSLNGSSYTSKGLNVRNIHGLKIGYLSYGRVITGYEKNDLIHFNYNNIPATVDPQFTIKNKEFISRGANVRDLKGKKLGYLKAGEILDGYKSKDYIYFEYQGQRARVLSKFVR
mgnify:FL=1